MPFGSARAEETEHGAPAPRAASTTPRGSDPNGGGARAAGALGTSANRSGEVNPRQDKRRSRVGLRQVAARHGRASWLRDCGRKSVSVGGAVAVRGVRGGVAGYAGLDTCGSVWACPVCAGKIGAHRADELATVIEWARREGHAVALLTLTARHRAGEPLRRVFDRITTGWETVTTGWASETERGYEKRQTKHENAWVDYRAGIRRKPSPLKPRRLGLAERSGVLGWARAVEATHGGHGWHVHLHVLLLLDKSMMPGDDLGTLVHVKQLEESVFTLWERGIRKDGGSVVRSPAADLRVMHGDAEETLSTYLTKGGDALAGQARGLAAETTLGQFKGGRTTGNVTPFELLGRLRETGDMDDADTWAEWVRATRGRKALTWSRSLRKLAGLLDERADLEIAAENTGGDDALLLPGETWRTIRDVVEMRCGILDAVEAGGRLAATSLLDSWGLPWSVAPDTAPQTRGRSAGRGRGSSRVTKA